MSYLFAWWAIGYISVFMQDFMVDKKPISLHHILVEYSICAFLGVFQLLITLNKGGWIDISVTRIALFMDTLESIIIINKK